MDLGYEIEIEAPTDFGSEVIVGCLDMSIMMKMDP